MASIISLPRMPVIPNNIDIKSINVKDSIRSNNKDIITNSIAPTTRFDSSPLQESDQWFDTQNQRVWVRNSSGLWVSEQLHIISNYTSSSGTPSNITNSTNFRNGITSKYSGVLITNLSLSYFASTPQDESNRYEFRASALRNSSTATALQTLDTITTTIGRTGKIYENHTPNIFTNITLQDSQLALIGLTIAKLNNAGNLSRFTFTMGVRDVY